MPTPVVPQPSAVLLTVALNNVQSDVPYASNCEENERAAGCIHFSISHFIRAPTWPVVPVHETFALPPRNPKHVLGRPAPILEVQHYVRPLHLSPSARLTGISSISNDVSLTTGVRIRRGNDTDGGWYRNSCHAGLKGANRRGAAHTPTWDNNH